MKSIEEQATKFLRDKELISKGFNHFIIDFPNDKEVNLGELLAEFAEEYAKQAVNAKLEEERKRMKKVNDKYGNFFDRVISDGENPEKAAKDLGLL